MPELPEVETIRAQLDPLLVGRSIVHAESHPSAKFTPAIEATGAGVDAVRRRGKYLLIDLDDDRELVIHLGMTGVLSVPNEREEGSYCRAQWQLDNDRWLVFNDVRRFGRIRVVRAGDYSSISTLHQLGPEPTDDAFTASHLHQALNKSSRRIKTQLLSQRPVAGLGNIYADEALWLARVKPRHARSQSQLPHACETPARKSSLPVSTTAARPCVTTAMPKAALAQTSTTCVATGAAVNHVNDAARHSPRLCLMPGLRPGAPRAKSASKTPLRSI